MTPLTLKIRQTLFSLTFFVFMSFTVKAQDCQTLIWSDEFDQSTLDLGSWQYDIGNGTGGWGNNEKQYYTDRTDNIKLEDGKLVITAKAETYGGQNYTSAKITSAGKRYFLYGRMEASIKLPRTQGMWPAFWMMPQNSFYGGWPRSGEIDIMEMRGSNVYSSHGTIHLGPDYANRRYIEGTYSGLDDLSDDFHTYAVEWKEDTISWYVDDVNFHNVSRTSVAPSDWPFDKEFFLIFNLAIGGWFGGDPNGTTVFPQTMEVNYVRVYSNPNTLHISGATKAIAGQTYQYTVTNGTADSYTWTLPAGATLVSGQGNDTINVLWGNTGGEIELEVTRGVCGSSTFYKTVNIIPNGCDVYFNDFETNVLLSYSPTTTGIQYDASSGNPGVNSVNNSSTVALYKRNPGDQYDVLKYDVNFLPTSVDYENGNNALYMDVYTGAPVGTEILWQFENKAKAGLAYPSGRRAVFRGVTTVQNQWQRIKFSLQNRPDLGTSPTAIDQFTILFRPNSYTSDTYYIDNLMRRDVLNCGVLTSVENAMEQNFMVSPNPAHDRVDITMRAMPSGKTEIVIMDVLGSERMRRTYEVSAASQIESIDITSLSPGLYIVYVRQENATIASRKVIVQ
ncbi:MAG: Glucan endo,3-beta-D-glucosidase [Cytophagaceae bacterium]|nr:Glucan endo,3-beta-D-glucosidase [Cytophagaceae bacterium]